MSEASFVFTATPHRLHYRLSSTSCQHYGELYNYFIIYYNVIIIEIKCTISNVLESSRNHPRRPRSMEDLSSMKLVPDAKKAGESWSRDTYPDTETIRAINVESEAVINTTK